MLGMHLPHIHDLLVKSAEIEPLLTLVEPFRPVEPRLEEKSAGATELLGRIGVVQSGISCGGPFVPVLLRFMINLECLAEKVEVARFAIQDCAALVPRLCGTLDHPDLLQSLHVPALLLPVENLQLPHVCGAVVDQHVHPAAAREQRLVCQLALRE